MSDEEQWKLDVEKIRNNNPEAIMLDKYRAYLGRLSRLILKPFLRKHELLNKRKIRYLKKNIENTFTDNLRKNTSDQTEDAYWNLRKVTLELTKASNQELEENKKILDGLYKLSLSCSIHGASLKRTDIYRNPCKRAQESLFKKIIKTEDCESPLVDSIKKFYKTCKNCPYQS